MHHGDSTQAEAGSAGLGSAVLWVECGDEANFFQTSDWNLAVPNHLADESQMR